jgi:hypothetical protein
MPPSAIFSVQTIVAKLMITNHMPEDNCSLRLAMYANVCTLHRKLLSFGGLDAARVECEGDCSLWTKRIL